MNIGQIISDKRKVLGLTQQMLAQKLNISFQAVSKWENGTSYPDITILPQLAAVLEVSIDTLLGYPFRSATNYDDRYTAAGYYWGLEPNHLCYEIMRLKPPIRPYRVLDIGCGEGKDAVFLARNGYDVTAFDISELGLSKTRELADAHGVSLKLFKGDVMHVGLDTEYDIIFSSGVFHYILPELREEVVENLKAHTATGGIHAINVFVQKPFVSPPPDAKTGEYDAGDWKSGELFMYYHDWFFHKMEERIFDCNSGGISHKHCMDVLVSEKTATYNF